MKTIPTKRQYKSPTAEAFLCPEPLRLLVSVSIEAGIEEWEEGEEL